MNLGINGFAGLNNYASDLFKTSYEKDEEDKKKEAMGIEDPIKDNNKPKTMEEKKKDKSDPNYECETCKRRKYQDGSDEMVSFKTAQHVSPTQAATAVRAHEEEHVSNAYTKASENNGKVVSCSVSIHTAVCPECGRTYVSGGTTSTQIKYYNESNPYQKDLKSQDSTKYAGMNVDAAC